MAREDHEDSQAIRVHRVLWENEVFLVSLE